MSQAVLLTWQGTVLCQDSEGRLLQRPFRHTGDIVIVRLPEGFGGFTHFLAGEAAVRVGLVAGPLADHVMHAPKGGGAVTLQQGGRFLSAAPDKQTVAMQNSAGEHETFLPVRLDELRQLQLILSNDWLLRSARRLVTASEIAIVSGHCLQFGPLLLNLAEQLPFESGTLPHYFTLHRDGWHVEQVRRYRPLIYFTAFRDPAVFAQLGVAMASLLDIGRYRGTVLLRVGAVPPGWRQDLPAIEPSRLIVRPVGVSDRTSFVTARYAMLDDPEMLEYQPIVYCDTDIVFDQPVADMLQAILACDNVTAPAESFSPLKRAVSVGADLLALDAVEPRYGIGFNFGTIGIPLPVLHGDALRLVRKLLVNRSDLFGRRKGGFIDQPVANYVSFRSAGFDTAVLTPFVRWGWSGISADPADRRGLVHFFPPRGMRAKYEAMAQYHRQILTVPPGARALG